MPPHNQKSDMKTYRKNKRALAAGALLPLLALLALAGAPHVLAKDATADITYTQQELARLVEQGCGEGRQADFGPVEANAGAFASLPEGAVLAEGVRAGTAQASWLRTLLDGKQHLSTTLAEAGYAAYTAYDLANHQLYIACANLTGEAKQLYLEVEQRGSMPYEAVSYRLAPVLEAAPETPEDVPPPEDAFPKGESEPTEPPESDPEHSPAGLSEDESTSILPAESDSAGPGAADTPAIEAQPEDPPASGSQAKEPIEETEDAPADAAPAKAPPAEQASAIISGFAPEEAARTGGADAKGPLVLSLPANGMGYIRFETGLLYGGSLAPSSRTRAALSTVSLATGSASPAEGAPGLLRL